MSKFSTFKEMQDQYEDEWVLVGDPELDKDLSVKTGVVLAHSEDRDVVYRKAMEIKPRHSAFLCFKRLARNQAIIL